MDTNMNWMDDIIWRAMNRPKELRFGQACYVYAHELFPVFVDQLNGTDADCFFCDARVPAFFVALKKKLNLE